MIKFIDACPVTDECQFIADILEIGDLYRLWLQYCLPVVPVE